MVSRNWSGVEGYKLAYGKEVNGGDFGLKIFVRMERDFTDIDKDALCKASEDLETDLRRETLRLNPETAASAALERAEILNLFATPIYVEEIPNGYCSRFCCAFKPWFIVTTVKGRIRIGWRKSVIHLEWTDSAIAQTAEQIFPREEAWPGYETTQYDKVIHAHGYEAARKYVNRLMAAV